MEKLEDFRLQTRDWLAENCPESMRRPIQSEHDQCWGGRNDESSEDGMTGTGEMHIRGNPADDTYDPIIPDQVEPQTTVHDERSGRPGLMPTPAWSPRSMTDSRNRHPRPFATAGSCWCG